MYGATVGQLGYLDIEAATNQAICVLVTDHDVTDPRFLYYALMQDRSRLIEAAHGAAQQNLSQASIREFSLRVPDICTQRRIAAILTAIDDLIENNRRRVEVLEEMARAIYREWFVHFRYPGHEDVPLVDSPLGPIPDGWGVREFGEVLGVLESGSRPKGGVGALADGVPSIGAENVDGLGRYHFSKEKYVSREFFNGMSQGRVESDDVLLYKDGAYIGRTAYVGRGYPHQECAINEHVFRIRGNSELPQGLLYFTLSSSEVQERVRGLNSNAAQPGLSQRKIREMPVVIAPADVADHFEVAAQPMLSEALDLANVMRQLAALRDLLLPKLVTGQIDVSHLDLDAITEAASP